jgi:hypothetical protein
MKSFYLSVSEAHLEAYVWAAFATSAILTSYLFFEGISLTKLDLSYPMLNIAIIAAHV